MSEDFVFGYVAGFLSCFLLVLWRIYTKEVFGIKKPAQGGQETSRG